MLLFDKEPIKDYFLNLFQIDVEHETDNPNYRCLRGLLHVVNATKVFLWMELFLVIPFYLFFLFPYCLHWIGIHLFLLLSTTYALKKEKHRWMWPFVIYAALHFFVWVLITALKFFLGIFSTDYFLELYGQGHLKDPFVRWGIVILIKCIVLLFGAFLFWKLTVVHTTRKYFEAKEDGAVDSKDPETATGFEKLMKPI